MEVRSICGSFTGRCCKAGAGMHLGNSSSDQKLFLSSDVNKRMQVCVTVELWFSDRIYPFITEGTKRFAQMKMSPPIQKTTSNLPKLYFASGELAIA
jgi:hypothetical protein